MPEQAAETPINIYLFLTLLAAACALFARRFKAMPYALVLVTAGLLFGLTHLLPSVKLEPHILFTVFLPPLLFESALNVRAGLLKKEAVPVGLLAVLGTLISAVVVGICIAPLLHLSLPTALLFGALISATDPISVIAVFKQLGAGKRLTLLIEAESLCNDGVAVVLFGTLLGVAGGGAFSLPNSVLQFFLVTLGGTVVGGLLGMTATLLTKNVDDHLLEITMTTIVAWGAYLLAETFHVSGVVAVVTAGYLVGNYGMSVSMSATTRLAVLSFWQYAAFAVNSVVFLLVGVEVAQINLWRSLPVVLAAFLVVLFARAASVYGLSGLVQVLPTKAKIPVNFRHVLVWGGLRGALGMALALGLAPNFEGRATLVTITFGVVFLSLIGQGLTIGPLLRKLGLAGQSEKEGDRDEADAQLIAARAGLEYLKKAVGEKRFAPSSLTPLFGDYHNRIDALEAEQVALKHGAKASSAEMQVQKARKEALIAEREALREAAHGGAADREQCRRLVGDIDAQLDELRQTVVD